MTAAQQAILTALSDHGPATAAVIADRAGLAYSTVTGSLRKLAAAGHVTRDETNTWTAAAPATASAPPERESSDDEPAEPMTATATHQGAAAVDDTLGDVQPEDIADDGAVTESGPPLGETTDPVSHPNPAEAVGSERDRNGPDRPDPQLPPVGAADAENADPATVAAHPDPAATDQDGEQPDGELAVKPRRPYTRSGKPPRKKHQLRGEVLAYLVARPGEQMTPRVIAKGVDASDGAVINACHKLAHDGAIERVETTKAMFVYPAPDATGTQPAS